MQCPYCITEINDEALACPHCTHDLYLFKPLLKKITDLEQKLADQADYEVLRERIQTLESQPVAVEPVSPTTHLLTGLRYWLIPLVMLLAAHALITIVYDLNTLYLRIVSLLIPLPFGFYLLRRNQQHFTVGLVGAFVMATIAVFGMSWITSLVDHTPVMPADRMEWREFAEYAASIGFSYLTGMLLSQIWHTRGKVSRSDLSMRLAEAASKGTHNATKIQELASKLNEFGGSISAAATTAAAIYTGLKGFFGG